MSIRENPRKWMMSATATLLLVVFPFGLPILLSDSADAQRSERARGAKIVSVSGARSVVRIGATYSSGNNAIAGNSMVSTNQRLIIPGGSTAGAVLDFIRGNGSPAGFRLSTGRSKYETRYYYTCAGRGGTFTMAWASATGAGHCRTFQVGSPLAATISPTAGRDTESEATSYAAKQFSYAAKQLQLAQQHNDYTPRSVFYCSAQAQAESDTAWGVAASQQPWDLFSPNDPCSRAIQECEGKLSSGSCEVNYTGERALKENNLTVALQCGRYQDDPRTLQTFRYQQQVGDQPYEVKPILVSGTQLQGAVENLKDQALAENVSSCTLEVVGLGEVVVYPKGSEITIAQVNQESDDRLVLTVLAGEVSTGSSQCLDNDGQTKYDTLRAGESVAYDLSQVLQRPSQQQQQQQQIYLPVGEVGVCPEPLFLTPSDVVSPVNTDSVRDLLLSDGLPQDYRNAFQEQSPEVYSAVFP